MKFPGGKRFAFTILDDTDVSTVENVRPMYRLLESLGMRTTKTVWPVGCPEGSRNFFRSQTLEDADYLAFVLDLHSRGFEITWHGATMESSVRERTVAALERFRVLFGQYPRVHAGHAGNRENLYWGADRVDDPLLKLIVRRITGEQDDYYQGHIPGSPYWWGDLCQAHFEYVRNLTFNRLNLETVNPSMPYRDNCRSHGRLWFSASDAEDADEFAELLSSRQQDRLEAEGGYCIVATHLGKGFVTNDVVHTGVADRLAELAARPGWFIPAGELLDHLAAQRSTQEIGGWEWRTMQWRWAWDLGFRRIRRALSPQGRTARRRKSPLPKTRSDKSRRGRR